MLFLFVAPPALVADRLARPDITLLHEIIATAEAILLGLPERERLPTTALFSAADEVLPRHGVVSEDVPHISRLLFRIGGTRGPESLLDKYRAALAEMGIELVYTDDSLTSGELRDLDEMRDPPPDRDDLSSLGDGPTPRASSAPRNDSTVLDLPESAPWQPERLSASNPMHYAPHRRRNSDSIALAFGANGNGVVSNGNGDPVSRMARSHSSAGLAPAVDAQRKEVRFSDVIDSQSVSDITWEDGTGGSTFDNIPFRPKTSEPEDLPKRPNGSAQPMSAHQEDDGRPATRAENRAPSDFSSRFGLLGQGFGSHFEGPVNGDAGSVSDEGLHLEGLGDDEGDAAGADEPSLPRHPAQSAEGPATQERQSPGEPQYNLRSSEYSPRRLPFRDAKDETEMDEDQIAFITSNEQTFLMCSFGHWRDVARYSRSYNIRADTHAEKWDAWETMGEALGVWIETALTMHVDENQGLEAYHEHMRQQQAPERNREDAERSPEHVPPTPPVLSQGSVNTRVRESIERSRESMSSLPRSVSDLRSTGGLSRHQSQSVERTLIDDLPHRPAPGRRSLDSGAQRLQSFGSNWEHSVAQSSEDEFRDASEDLEILESEEVEQVEVRFHTQYEIAAAAWDFFLMSKAFTHWANRAEEEVQRTQIARRHILRRRYFSAWLGQEEKDETEAESKAVWFGQLVALKQWRNVAIVCSKTRGLWQQVAERKERRDLAGQTLTDWYQESKMRLAEAIDSQRLRTACLLHWQAEGGWLDSAHEEAEGIFKGTLLGSYIRYWGAESHIQQRAEAGAGPVIARRDEFLRSGLALAWRHEAELNVTHERAAVVRELGDLTKHWLYETRLIEWQEEQAAEDLVGLTCHWYCERRLIICQRVIDQQEKARFFGKWAGAARAASTRTYHLRQVAREYRHHLSIQGFLDSGREVLEQLEEQASHARGMTVQRVVPKLVRKWTAQLKPHHRMRHISHVGRLFYATDAILPHWQEVRKQEWQRRMHRLYRNTRYRFNKDAVRGCLDAWRRSTAKALTKGWEADDMRVVDDSNMTVEMTGAWRSRLERVTFSHEVSEDADKEIHLIQWHSLVEAHDETRLDAAEFDYAQTAGAYWDEWTLASVAQRGREQTIHEFGGHNARRDQRHFFAVWASHTSNIGDRVPEMMDFRATRRSSRWTTPAPQRTRLMTDYTPFRTPARPNLFRQSTTTPAYRPPSEMTFEEED